MNTIGWIGTQLLAWCGLPAVIDVVQSGTAVGYSIVFLLMWLSGEILSLIYVLNMKEIPVPILVNYFINIFLISIIVYYKI